MALDTRVIPLFRYLHWEFENFVRFQWRGWEIKDRYQAHQELSGAFVFVTPGSIWLQLCNAEAVADAFARKGDFLRPVEMLAMLNVFGLNNATTEGQQWQRQRKIIAACFNEHNNEIVWSESIYQATGMRRYWSSKASVKSIADDVRTVSLHIMPSAGFGKAYPFRGAGEISITYDSTSIIKML